MTTKSTIPREHAHASYEIYDFPGEYAEIGDGEKYVQTRIEELQAQYEQLNGAGDARGLSVGALFTLTGYPRSDQDREYLITEANHTIEVAGYEAHSPAPETVYSCRFSAIESMQNFRSSRTTSKPLVQGPQTAIVVGPAGEEIWTDEHGRVKCQFHWDREGGMDENSSCWIRVSQVHAGKIIRMKLQQRTAQLSTPIALTREAKLNRYRNARPVLAAQGGHLLKSGRLCTICCSIVY